MYIYIYIYIYIPTGYSVASSVGSKAGDVSALGSAPIVVIIRRRILVLLLLLLIIIIIKNIIYNNNTYNISYMIIIVKLTVIVAIIVIIIIVMGSGLRIRGSRPWDPRRGARPRGTWACRERAVLHTTSDVFA